MLSKVRENLEDETEPIHVQVEPGLRPRPVIALEAPHALYDFRLDEAPPDCLIG